MATVSKPPVPSHDDQQLRRDRITTIVMLIVMMVIFALIMWLASFGNGSAESIDYWTVPF